MFLIFYIIISKGTFKVDEDYKKLDLALESYNINYYTVYEDDALMKYKVYKLNIIGENEKFRNKLKKSSYWSKNRLDDSILDDFEYNKEVLEIKNGYYHYELVCRTSDENKKHNFTKEEATGWEIGVYDADKNILYYYWQSR